MVASPNHVFHCQQHKWSTCANFCGSVVNKCCYGRRSNKRYYAATNSAQSSLPRRFVCTCGFFCIFFTQTQNAECVLMNANMCLQGTAYSRRKFVVTPCRICAVLYLSAQTVLRHKHVYKCGFCTLLFDNKRNITNVSFVRATNVPKITDESFTS